MNRIRSSRKLHLHFTFQSGSIQIKVNLGFNIGAEYFTFQSGSIQIYRY